MLHNAWLDSFVNEAFCQCQCIMTWEKCGGSRFIGFTTYFAPNYKTIFFFELRNRTHWYMLEPIPLRAIRNIVSMRLSSHTLRWEWEIMNTLLETSLGIWVSHFDTMFFLSSYLTILFLAIDFKEVFIRWIGDCWLLRLHVHHARSMSDIMVTLNDFVMSSLNNMFHQL